MKKKPIEITFSDSDKDRYKEAEKKICDKITEAAEIADSCKMPLTAHLLRDLVVEIQKPLYFGFKELIGVNDAEIN